MRKNFWAIKHDLSNTRIYRIWMGMKARCYNKNAVPYPYYGAKGIRVCDEWTDKKNGFMNFYNWSMEHGYKEDLTIDRIDPTKDYTPDNCKWATKYEQNVHLRRKLSVSGYRGISKHSNHNSYYGRVKVHGKVICTGSAPTALEAAILRDKYILKNGLINELNGVTDETI